MSIVSIERDPLSRFVIRARFTMRSVIPQPPSRNRHAIRDAAQARRDQLPDLPRFIPVYTAKITSYPAKIDSTQRDETPADQG